MMYEYHDCKIINIKGTGTSTPQTHQSHVNHEHEHHTTPQTHHAHITSTVQTHHDKTQSQNKIKNKNEKSKTNKIVTRIFRIHDARTHTPHTETALRQTRSREQYVRAARYYEINTKKANKQK